MGDYGSLNRWWWVGVGVERAILGDTKQVPGVVQGAEGSLDSVSGSYQQAVPPSHTNLTPLKL